MRLWPGHGQQRQSATRERPRSRPTPFELTGKPHADVTGEPFAFGAVLELQAAAFLLERQASSFTVAYLTDYLERAGAYGRCERPTEDATTLGELVTSCQDALERVGRAVNDLARPVIQIPSELLYQSWLSLFPAERMAIIGGRRTGHGLVLGPAFDVTSGGPETSRVHVRADRDRLRTALLGLERAGAHLAGWIHSHPGIGTHATQPSSLDRAQHQDWVRDYSAHLVSLIVVADGVVRLWGTAIESRQIRVEILGSGATPISGDEHVYRLAR